MSEKEIQHDTIDAKGHLRTTVTLNPGDKVALCRCMQSKKFPFCDGTHRTIEGKFGPVLVEVKEIADD